jgi:hypothetical protein
MDGSISRYFLTMDDTSPDGLSDCDEESMEDGHYGVTECGPYERNYAQRGNERLEPTGSQPEMDRGRRWIAAREGLQPEMDDKRWITGDG